MRLCRNYHANLCARTDPNAAEGGCCRFLTLIQCSDRPARAYGVAAFSPSWRMVPELQHCNHVL